MTEHLFWITSRAAGAAALLFASAAMFLGLLMGGRFVTRRGIDLRATHEALSLATIGALLVHALALLGDGYLSPSLADISIPFASDFETVWMSLGVAAGWLLIVLGLSYYVRRWIGVARWRTLHRFTALAWLMGVGHALAMGTDVGERWMAVPLAIAVIPTAVLLLMRLTTAPAPPRPSAA